MAKKAQSNPTPSRPDSLDYESVIREKDDLILQLQEANRLTSESLEQLQRQLADRAYPSSEPLEQANPLIGSFSPGEKLYLMAACIGALKDPQNLGPLDDANFQAQLPLFVDQAETLFTRLIERIQNPTL